MESAFPILEEQLLLEQRLLDLTQDGMSIQQGQHEMELDKLTSEAQQDSLDLQRALAIANYDINRLKLEVIRWRKQYSLQRLKLSSYKESATILNGNIDTLAAREATLTETNALLAQQLAATQAALAVTNQKADAMAHAAASNKDGLDAAGSEVARLTEELRLAGTRYTVSVTQCQELEQQLHELQTHLLGAQAEVAALRGRALNAEAAQQSSRAALEAKDHELVRTKEALAAAQEATRAAELAVQSAQATAALAQERLQLKEEQLAKWMTIEDERKQVMRQREEQLQELSQTRLEGLRSQANVSEQRLLDQITHLQEQLKHEQAARSAEREAAQRTSDAANENTQQVKTLRAQLLALQDKLAAAEKERQVAEAASTAAARSLETTQAALAQAQAQQQLLAEEAAAAAARAAALSAELGQVKAQQVGEAMELVETLVNTLPDDEQPLERGKAAAGAQGRAKGQQQQQERGQRVQQKEQLGDIEKDEGAGGKGDLAGENEAQAELEGSKSQKKSPGARRGSAARDGQGGAGGPGAGAGSSMGAQGRPALSDISINRGDQLVDDGMEDLPTQLGKKGSVSTKQAATLQKSPMQTDAAKKRKDLPPAAAYTGGEDVQAAAAGQTHNEPQRRRSGAKGKADSSSRPPAADLARGAGAAAGGGGFSQPEPQATPAVAVPAASVAAGPAQPGGWPTATAARDPLAGFRDQAALAAAQSRQSAMSLLSKLHQQTTGAGDKPGARKRRLGSVQTPGAIWDTLPSSLIMTHSFKAPKVRKAGN